MKRFFVLTLFCLLSGCWVGVREEISGAPAWRGGKLEIDALSGRIWSIAFSPDGSRIASSHDDRIRVWDAASGERVAEMADLDDFVATVVFSPDGGTVLSASDDGGISLWDAARGTRLETLGGLSDGAQGLAFSRNGKRFASGSLNGESSLSMRDLKSGAVVWKHGYGDSSFVDAPCFSHDGRLVIASVWGAGIAVHEAKTGKLLRTIECPVSPQAAVFLPGDRKILSADSGEGIRVYDRKTGERIMEAQAMEDGRINALALSPKGDVFATAGTDALVKIWDAKNLALLETFEGHDREVNALAWAKGGRRLASAGEDGRIIIWEFSR